jgi:ribokinase
MAEQRLSPNQAALIDHVDWLVVTVGPAAALSDALDRAPDKARIAWLVKSDETAFTPDLRLRLANRADLIAHSAAEFSFVESALAAAGSRAGRLVVETHGSDGLRWRSEQLDGSSNSGLQSVEPRMVQDLTGAGDTLAGGLLAGLIGGHPIEKAVTLGVNTVDRLLARREAVEHPNTPGPNPMELR